MEAASAAFFPLIKRPSLFVTFPFCKHLKFPFIYNVHIHPEQVPGFTLQEISR